MLEDSFKPIIDLLEKAKITEKDNIYFDKIKNLIDLINNLDIKNITKTEIDKISIIVDDLDQNIDCLNELSYYFDPIKISIEKQLHNQYVLDLRKQNKKKVK